MIIVIKIIIITVTIIKCRGRSKTLTRTNTELHVTLYNDRRPFTNITKSSASDVAWVLYATLKRLIHHLTQRVGVDHAYLVGHRQKELGASYETVFPTSFDVLPFSSEFFEIMKFTKLM